MSNSEDLSLQAIFLLIPLVGLITIIILGNLFICLAVIIEKSLRTPPNIYLVSLASIDLFVGAFILPLNIAQWINQKWIHGTTLCGIWLTADVCLCTLSIYHLIAIAVDRYRAITEGIHYVQQRSIKSVVWTVIFLWIVALWISTPPVLGWNLNDWGGTNQTSVMICQLTSNKGYVLHSAFGALIFPMFLMVLIYLKIYSAIKEKLQERSKVQGFEGSAVNRFSLSNTGSSEDILEDKPRGKKKSSIFSLNTLKFKETSSSIEKNEDSISTGIIIRQTIKKSRNRPTTQIQEFMQKKLKFSLSKERRAAKTLGIIITAFIACWLPFCCLYIVNAFVGEEYKASAVWFDLFTWLSYLNSAINPFIYSRYNKDFRKAFKRLVCYRQTN